MRVRSILALAGLLATILTAAPAGAGPDGDPKGAVIGGHYGHGAMGPGSYATLIDVHEIKPYKGKPGGSGTANCTEDPDPVPNGGYLLTGWQLKDTTAVLSRATVPSALLAGIDGALQNSWSVWNAGAVPDVTQSPSGSSVTKYTANAENDVLFGRTGSSLATTYTWRWNNGHVESDVVFNKSVAWYHETTVADGCNTEAGARYDVANIATHEFGHALGLDHPPGGRWETMYAYGYSGETLKRTPAPGDLAGAQDVYDGEPTQP